MNASSFYGQYTEASQGDSGGKGNKYSSTVMVFGAKNLDADMTLLPNTFYAATAQTHLTGSFYLWNENDANNSMYWRAGISTGSARNINTSWLDNLGVGQWGIEANTAGATGSWILSRASAGSPPRRLSFFGPSSGGIVRLSSESTGGVEINSDGSSGTGGLKVYSGGGSPSLSATIDSAGLGTFNGGVKAGSSGSTISDSRELLQNVHLCGTTSTCANTSNGSYRMIFGNVALSAGTVLVSSITAFTSTSSYVCTGTDKTAIAAVQIVNTSTTSFTINGTGSDSIDYVCVGK